MYSAAFSPPGSPVPRPSNSAEARMERCAFAVSGVISDAYFCCTGSWAIIHPQKAGMRNKDNNCFIALRYEALATRLRQLHRYEQHILFTRLACRPPSNSVVMNLSMIAFASSRSMKRAGIHTMLASLCCRARAASSSSQQMAARMP